MINANTSFLKQRQQMISPPIVYMTTDSFHRIAGHINERALHRTAHHYNIVLQGKLSPCIFCSLANIHRSSISSETLPRCTAPGERVFIDITKLSHPSIAGNKFWLIVVDDATDYCWSFFYKE